MSRSKRKGRCGRDCGACAGMRSDVPIARERVAQRDLKPENVQAAVDDEYDDPYDTCCDDFDDYEEMLWPALPLRVSFLEAVKIV